MSNPTHERTTIQTVVMNILLGNPQPMAPAPPVYPIDGVGANVFPNRPTSAWKEEMPALFVYTLHEMSRSDGRRPISYDRDLELVVEARVTANSESDVTANGILKAVENLLNGNLYLLDPVTGLTYLTILEMQESNIGFIAGRTVDTICSAWVKYKAEYISTPVPPTPSGSFKYADVKYAIENYLSTHPTPAAEDYIVLRGG